MQIARDDRLPINNDHDLIVETLSLTNSSVVELGCGNAMLLRRLAQTYPDCRFLGFEVDEIQHAKNLAGEAFPNLVFKLGGAQSTELSSDSVDAVLMLKSLHHVPMDAMGAALKEIARILKTGGTAYISEPVYQGEFNEILRLFHDEKQVRQAAFEAIQNAIGTNALSLDREVHFLSESRFAGFEEFEQRIIGATHSTFAIDEALMSEIRAAFLPFIRADGTAIFHNPMRADILRCPG